MRKILILHGWTYSTEKWEPFVETLKKEGFSCELLTIPGLTEEIDRAWTLDDYVEWLDKKVSSVKGGVILLGHSNGGRVSLAYALAHPKKIERVILLDSAGVYHKDFSIQLKRVLFRNLAKFKKFISSKTLEKLLYKAAREKDYHTAPPLAKETMKNLISVDLTPHLKEIKIPVTIIWGQQDTITPVSDGKIIHSQIINSTLSIIPNAKHSPQFTHANEVITIIKKELQQ